MKWEVFGDDFLDAGPWAWVVRGCDALGATRYRTFRKVRILASPALFATGVEILSRSFVAMPVGSHHGNECLRSL
jgi:hypothetical protein